MTRFFLTVLAISTAVAGMFAPASAADNEPALHFQDFACEIDTEPLNVNYTLDGMKSILTYDTDRLCTGAASARNVKLTCTATLPGWNFGNRSASGFPCGMFTGVCGLPQSFVDTADSSLTVDSTGVANLQCFFKPQ